MPAEELRTEAAKLRMLQVEKGISIDRLQTSGDDGRIAALIIRRDNELMAQEAIATGSRENPALGFAGMLSRSLARQVDASNALVEREVDKERFNKMKRKALAAIAGGTVGLFTLGKLFNTPQNPELPPSPEGVPVPPGLENAGDIHVVTSGENTWKIIESKLNAKHALDGLANGVDTHMIDSLKDRFAQLSPDALKSLGFSSGNIDMIYPGDALNMSGIVNTQTIFESFGNAQNLSPAQISSIVENNSKIANWLILHRAELTGPLNSSIIEDIIKGVR